MKQNLHRSGSGKLRAVFCLGLAAALAVGVAVNSTAAGASPTEYDVKVVSSGTHTAALSGSDLYLWGANSNGQLVGFDEIFTNEPTLLRSDVTDVAVSDSRTLVVTEDGSLISYGLEPATNIVSPKSGSILAGNAAKVAAAESFAAYIDGDGALYTWGRNDSGQLGNGNTNNSSHFVKVFDEGVSKVALGSNFALALTEDGTVYGWGSNDRAQLGSAGNEMETSPIIITDNAQDITAGFSHACILKKNGTLFTSGSNLMGQCGLPSLEQVELTEILTGVRSISTGYNHNFAVANDGAVYVWGYGQSGQLGVGSSTILENPTETEFTFVQVFANGNDTFGVLPDGSICSCGSNINFQLGKLDGTDSLSPSVILDADMNWVYEELMDDAHAIYNNSEEEAILPSAEPQPGTIHVGDSQITEDPEADPVTFIVIKAFVSGDGNGNFLPSQNVTRAQFLRMVVDGVCVDFDKDSQTGTSSFTDVVAGKWYEKYIVYAEQKGIVSGNGDGTFKPDTAITRAEAAVILAKAMGLDTSAAVSSSFRDVPEGRYFTKPINALAALGILNGDGTGNFNPQKNITRAEAVTMIAQATGFQPSAELKAELKGSFTESPFSDVNSGAWYYSYLLRGVGYVANDGSYIID